MYFAIEEKIIGKFNYGQLDVSPDDSSGYRPYELFVSSMIGCSGAILRKILTKKKQPFTSIKAEISSVRNSEAANRIEQLSVTAFVVTEKPLSNEQEEKIAQLVIDNCGMLQSVKGSIDLTFRVKTMNEEPPTS